MTSVFKFTLPYLIAALALGAAPLAAQTLTGSEWGPTDISGTSIESTGDVFVRFEQDGTFVGNGGCNSFRGRYVTNGDAILFGPSAATMKLCEETVSATETLFFQSLAQARIFLRNGSELGLSDADGNAVIRLSLRDTK